VWGRLGSANPEKQMLANKDAMATIPVKDVKAARKFYEDKLGFPKGHEEMGGGVVTYRSGKSTVLVYQSEFAGTNKATTATWGVGTEFDAIVGNLQKAGVAFEHYKIPGGELDGDVHRFGNFKAAWFRDPDGNILHVNNG
jgi:catechol 2,3-dioxygenase-like lactoylglutathione lyase family enzyme